MMLSLQIAFGIILVPVILGIAFWILAMLGFFIEWLDRHPTLKFVVGLYAVAFAIIGVSVLTGHTQWLAR